MNTGMRTICWRMNACWEGVRSPDPMDPEDIGARSTRHDHLRCAPDGEGPAWQDTAADCQVVPDPDFDDCTGDLVSGISIRSGGHYAQADRTPVDVVIDISFRYPNSAALAVNDCVASSFLSKVGHEVVVPHRQ